MQLGEPTSVSQILFHKYDVHHSGSITVAEFKDLCYDLGHFLSNEQAAIAVKMIDRDGNGTIEYNEFMKWWRSENKWGKLELDEKQLGALQRASTYFRFFDKHKEGSLNKQEFQSLHADLLKNKFTTKNLEQCLQDLDENNDGKIQFNEYIDWLVRIGSIPIKVLP